MTDDSPTSGGSSDLNPPLTATGLSAGVVRRREVAATRNEASRERLEAGIDAHVHAHRLALDYLRSTHQRIAETFDFNLVDDTRAAAIWQMAGRCLGIAYLILDSLQLGYTAEVLHLGRALHEADRLLDVFHMQGEDALLRQWIRGDYVSPADARKAEERFDALLADAMREKGIEGEVGDRRGLSKTMFENLSEAAHHRRRWTQDAVFADERTMLVGRAEHLVRRAATTGVLVAVVEESVIAVGSALGQFIYDRSWYEERVEPFVESFHALQRTHPLV